MSTCAFLNLSLNIITCIKVWCTRFLCVLMVLSYTFIFMYKRLYVSVFVCMSTGGPAPPRPSSSAPPVFGLWWPWWGHLYLPRPPAPGWRRGRECPPAPSLWPDTTSQTPPPTPRAEATSCVDRKQEGSSAAVISAVMFGTQYLWWDPVDTLQQWFVYL